MFELKVTGAFEAAHRLENYSGKCSRLHGHNWTVEAKVAGKKLNQTGMLIDFKILKSELKKVLDEFDHRYLNELKIFETENPTAENLSRIIFEKFSRSEIFQGSARLKSITVFETPGSGVTYYPD